jgi:hypothetical protein
MLECPGHRRTPFKIAVVDRCLQGGARRWTEVIAAAKAATARSSRRSAQTKLIEQKHNSAMPPCQALFPECKIMASALQKAVAAVRSNLQAYTTLWKGVFPFRLTPAARAITIRTATVEEADVGRIREQFPISRGDRGGLVDALSVQIYGSTPADQFGRPGTSLRTPHPSTTG